MTGACAVGVQHRYDTTNAVINVTTEQSVAVAVQDSRPYVLSGNKPTEFVGLSRGGFGNPFDVTTSSGRPLAQDMTMSIVSALSEKKIAASAIMLPQGADATTVQALLIKSSADRKIWMILTEWKADTYGTTALLYDVTLRILGPDGQERGKKRIEGKDNLGGGVINMPEYSREALPKAFRNKLEELLNDPVTAAALK